MEPTVAEMQSTGPRALRALRPLFLAIPEDVLLEPKVQLSVVLDEARELTMILARPAVRERLRCAGLSDERLDALAVATEALAESQKRWLQARAQGKSARQIEAEALAFPLRDEMVGACRFQLDGALVLELLARVTDGENTRDLIQDLRELAVFVRDNAKAFERDSSFDALACAEEAVELASAIVPDGERDELAALRLELRDRAFTHLCALVEELRQAGRYAYRGTVQARAYFASNTMPARRRRPLPSAVRVLAG